MNPKPAAAARTEPPPTGAAVNDFTVKVGTVNGSGSQTSNTVLLRAIFRMGVPVTGKNIFPSNIAGLPTWFVIRASRRGYLAGKKVVDLAVPMNPATAKRDVAEVRPGGAVVHEEGMDLSSLRDDVTFYPVPFQRIVAEVCENARLRRLVVNMVYVGVVGRLIGIEREAIDGALEAAFADKPKALGLNRAAVEAGWKYAEEHFPGAAPCRLERMRLTEGKILVDGNAAAALGCLFAGVGFVSWYPITPSSSLGEALIGYLEAHRRDGDGRRTFAVVQAEDELAALGMTLGAGWAGARAMTTTSGPGISLMAEFVGYGYYAEIPCVLFDVQRAGPSTGLPTRTAQGDVLSCAVLSHGDTRHLLLLPSSVEEVYRMAIDAFDLSERFQTPVFVLSDLDLGMNLWMSDPFPYPEKDLVRGKVLDREALEGLGAGGFRRYDDRDGDGIPRRTLPGTPGGLGAYFTRGSGHDEAARYTEDPEAYARLLDRIVRKMETARGELPPPEVRLADPGAGPGPVGILHYGTSRWAVEEALDLLREERGPVPDACRVLAWPFHDGVREFLESHERVFVVEQNRDGQLAALLKMDLPDLAGRLRSILHYDGEPLVARTVADAFAEAEEREGRGA